MKCVALAVSKFGMIDEKFTGLTYISHCMVFS